MGTDARVELVLSPAGQSIGGRVDIMALVPGPVEKRRAGRSATGRSQRRMGNVTQNGYDLAARIGTQRSGPQQIPFDLSA